MTRPHTYGYMVQAACVVHVHSQLYGCKANLTFAQCLSIQLGNNEMSWHAEYATNISDLNIDLLSGFEAAQRLM